MSTFTFLTQILAYDDDVSASNPLMRLVDWKRSILGVSSPDIRAQKLTIDPGASVTTVDGSRATSIDNTTDFSLSLSAIDSSRYRIAHTGGTAPAFRTDRGLDLSSLSVTLTANANLTVTVTVSAGTPFGSVQVGDVVFLPGTATGDSPSAFDPLNVGYWNVLSATSSQLVLAREDGTVFEGKTETVALPLNSELAFQAFSAAGVQIDDTVVLSTGFALTAQRAYLIVAVNPEWIEIVSTTPLGAQTGVQPGTAGLSIYSSALRFFYIETDQDLVVRCNGDTSDINRISPWIPGDPANVGSTHKVGPTWKLVLVNKSTSQVKVLLVSAE